MSITRTLSLPLLVLLAGTACTDPVATTPAPTFEAQLSGARQGQLTGSARLDTQTGFVLSDDTIGEEVTILALTTEPSLSGTTAITMWMPGAAREGQIELVLTGSAGAAMTEMLDARRMRSSLMTAGRLTIERVTSEEISGSFVVHFDRFHVLRMPAESVPVGTPIEPDVLEEGTSVFTLRGTFRAQPLDPA